MCFLVDGTVYLSDKPLSDLTTGLTVLLMVTGPILVSTPREALSGRHGVAWTPVNVLR